RLLRVTSWCLRWCHRRKNSVASKGVGECLRHAAFSVDKRHPLIFPSESHFCSDIFSDCSMNFTGADRQLREFFMPYTLAAHPKWIKPKASRVGSLCLLRSEIMPSCKWHLAGITKLHPGDDGVVRVVTLRTASSELIRPLIKVVLLPGDINASTLPENA
ncbi:hypothetical protein ALC56_07188, partial [Trachymyrmex septentrionalis]